VYANTSCPVSRANNATNTHGGELSRRIIDGIQNEEGGKGLCRFYLYNRSIEKDKYLV
jgi:hypothetical protein